MDDQTPDKVMDEIRESLRRSKQVLSESPAVLEFLGDSTSVCDLDADGLERLRKHLEDRLATLKLGAAIRSGSCR